MRQQLQIEDKPVLDEITDIIVGTRPPPPQLVYPKFYRADTRARDKEKERRQRAYHRAWRNWEMQCWHLRYQATPAAQRVYWMLSGADELRAQAARLIRCHRCGAVTTLEKGVERSDDIWLCGACDNVFWRSVPGLKTTWGESPEAALARAQQWPLLALDHLAQDLKKAVEGNQRLWRRCRDLTEEERVAIIRASRRERVYIHTARRLEISTDFRAMGGTIGPK